MAKNDIEKKPSRLKDLLIMFAIPIMVAFFAAAVIYVPRLFANPQYDFIYSSCSEYVCDNQYSVDRSGKLIESNTKNYYQDASLNYYDVKSNSSRTIDIEEAQKYKLNKSLESPDGYSLVKKSNTSFLFATSNNKGWILRNGSKVKEVKLIDDENQEIINNKLLGWVEK